MYELFVAIYILLEGGGIDFLFKTTLLMLLYVYRGIKNALYVNE